MSSNIGFLISEARKETSSRKGTTVRTVPSRGSRWPEMIVVALAVTVSARANPVPATSAARPARRGRHLVAIEDSVHVGRGQDSRPAGKDDVSGRVYGAAVAGDTPGSCYPGRVSRKLWWDAVTGGAARAAVG